MNWHQWHRDNRSIQSRYASRYVSFWSDNRFIVFSHSSLFCESACIIIVISYERSNTAIMPKRKCYTVREKLNLIDRVRNGEGQTKVAREMCVAESGLRGWLKGWKQTSRICWQCRRERRIIKEESKNRYRPSPWQSFIQLVCSRTCRRQANIRWYCTSSSSQDQQQWKLFSK